MPDADAGEMLVEKLARSNWAPTQSAGHPEDLQEVTRLGPHALFAQVQTLLWAHKRQRARLTILADARKVLSMQVRALSASPSQEVLSCSHDGKRDSLARQQTSSHTHVAGFNTCTTVSKSGPRTRLCSVGHVAAAASPAADVCGTG